MPDDLEIEFNRAMTDIYVTAKRECSYSATRFLSMIADLGGLETARRLIRAAHESEGYENLWERGRLDLTVEALILDPKWRTLFTDNDRAIAEKRLEQYGYEA
jgi:hypothetical protein